MVFGYNNSKRRTAFFRANSRAGIVRYAAVEHIETAMEAS